MTPNARRRLQGRFLYKRSRVAWLIAVAIFATACSYDDLRGVPVAKMVNDLDAPVELRLCSSNDCGGFYAPKKTVQPGRSWSVNVSERGVPNVYLVQGLDGRRYGCLPFVAPSHRSETIVVRVSEHVACRGTLDEKQFWPPRWERLK
jgi:hypothetical protein